MGSDPLRNYLAYRVGGDGVEGARDYNPFVSIEAESWREHWQLVLLLLCVCVFAGVARAQQGAATGEPLVVETASLPKAYLRQPYEAHLQAHGGIAPLRWEVTEGALASGIVLGRDGILSGIPVETGEFRFTVTVTDGG